MKTIKIISLMLIGAILVCCGKDPEENNGNGNNSTEQHNQAKPGEPISVVDGKVRFYLSEKDNSIRAVAGLGISDWKSFNVSIGGVDYPVLLTDEGEPYIEADPASAYNGVLYSESSSRYYGLSRYVGVVLPYSQFQHTAGSEIAALPMYASYSEATGNVLTFSPLVSAIALTIMGDAALFSIKVESSDGNALGGTGTYQASKRQVTMTRSVPFAVLNCTNRGSGSPIIASGTKFIILVAPGAFPSGLDVTICDSNHKMVHKHLDIKSLSADTVAEATIAYEPDKDLLFYDGFDNCVWGGDIVGGSATYGFAPDTEDVGTGSRTQLSGYEMASSATEYTTAGSGFFQPDVWTSVVGKTVGTARQMSATYIRSRGFEDYSYLFRCQEHQGYIGVGTGNAYHGIVQTRTLGFNELMDVTVAFDYCPKVGFSDEVCLHTVNGGKVTSVLIDGQSAALNESASHFVGTGSTCALSKKAVTPPVSTGEKKQWHHVEFYLENVDSATQINLSTTDEGSGSHGWYLDNLEIRKVRTRRAGVKTIRVMYWNIQDGMWADQGNNYNNFVTWVKKYSPDVCVWCEARSLFKTDSEERLATKERYLENGWKSLASRYGHNYTSHAAVRDNYPQEITSKYPIEVKELITGPADGNPVCHGAGLFSINFDGTPVYFLSLHLWPQKYGYGVSTDAQSASAAANEGDYYREYETKWLVDEVINKPAYSAQPYWLVMGDSNSKSSLDINYYGLPQSSTQFLAHDYLLKNTNLVDVIASRYPGDFVSTVCSETSPSRIDLMYASPDMYGCIENAVVVIDDWTVLKQSSKVSSYFCEPSDHRPVMVDFKIKQ